MQTEKIKENQISSVVEMYQQELPQSFFARLGTKFLHALFGSTIKTKNSFTLVAQEGDEVIGFATCTLNQTELFINICRQKPLSVCWELTKQTLKTPSLIKEYLALLKYSRQEKENLKPQLLSFAVKNTFQRQGVGQILLQAVKKEFKTLGIPKFKVGVWEKMEGANRFYRKTGGKFLEEINLPGRKIIYYQYETR